MSNPAIKEAMQVGDEVTLEEHDLPREFNLFNVLAIDEQKENIEVTPSEGNEIEFEDGSLWVGLAAISGLYPSKIIVLRHE